MSDGVSVYTENLVLSALLRGQQAVVSGTWLALFTAYPADGLGGEVTAAEYVRVSVTFDATFVNDAELVWPMAVTSWGSIEYLVVVDSGVKGAGNIILWEDGVGNTVIPGRRVKIAAGQFAVSMDTI